MYFFLFFYILILLGTIPYLPFLVWKPTYYESLVLIFHVYYFYVFKFLSNGYILYSFHFSPLISFILTLMHLSPPKFILWHLWKNPASWKFPLAFILFFILHHYTFIIWFYCWYTIMKSIFPFLIRYHFYDLIAYANFSFMFFCKWKQQYCSYF